MTPLEKALQIPEFISLTDQQALDFGKQPGTPVVNNSLQSVAALSKKVGQSNARIVVSTVKEAATQDPLVDSFFYKLSGIGIDWSDSEIQAQIDALSVLGQWPEGLADQVKTLGVDTPTLWKEWKIEPEPTIEQIAAARAENSRRSAVTSFCNNVLNPLLSSGTPEEIKSAVAAWEP